MTPRSRTQVENVMGGKREENLRMSTFASCLRPPSHMAWVLEELRRRRLEAVQAVRVSIDRLIWVRAVSASRGSV